MKALLDQPTLETIAALVATECPDEGIWFHGTPHQFSVFTSQPPERNSRDWNARLGIHFCRDQSLATEVFLFNGGQLIEARLTLANPARFDDELDLDDLAIDLLGEAGIGVDYSGWASGEEVERHYCLNDHDGAAAAGLVGAYLRERGHDGIIYGNAIDGLSVCAVAFRPEQITVISQRRSRSLGRLIE
jgi:hypothetical protein